jgi:hypothetical protein
MYGADLSLFDTVPLSLCCTERRRRLRLHVVVADVLRGGGASYQPEVIHTLSKTPFFSVFFSKIHLNTN